MTVSAAEAVEASRRITLAVHAIAPGSTRLELVTALAAALGWTLADMTATREITISELEAVLSFVGQMAGLADLHRSTTRNNSKKRE